MNGECRKNLRLRRARIACNQTQQQVADAIGARLGHPVDVEYLGRLERGVITWPNAGYRAAFRAHFGVASDAELGFYSRRSVPAPPWEDNVRRRAVLTALPVAGMAMSEPLTALVDAALAESSPIPRRVGAEEVEQVRALRTHGHELAQRFSGGGTREMLGAQLRWAVGLLDAHVDPSVHHELHSEVGGLARHAGWVSHDVGVDTAANRYCEVALRCAGQAEDWSLRGKTLGDLSRIAEYCGDGDMALTLAQQAMVRPDRITALERAGVSAVEAAAHGRRGDREACRAAIGRAEDFFSAANPATESPTMVAFFSPAELADTSAFALWPLAMRGHAVTETANLLRTAADTHAPDHVRARILCLIRLATLQFAHGDPDEALAVANTALDAAPVAQSRRHADDLTTLRYAARRHRTLPGVPDLLQRLNRALANV
jgi:transcriptional regulator with XRE-family HTH domain